MEREDRVVIPELLVGALGFYRAPQRFAQLRDPAQPLPAGVTGLLAAGAQALAPEHIVATAARLGSNPQELHDAVLFFIRQAMLEVAGDHYRTLGVARDADTGLIRQHYHYLIRLFHPDRDLDNEGWDTLYAPLINAAWNVLRNPQKREAYDASLALPGEGGPITGTTPTAAASATHARHPRHARNRAPLNRSFVGRLGLFALAGLVILLGMLSLRQPAQPALRVTAPGAGAAEVKPGQPDGEPDVAQARVDDRGGGGADTGGAAALPGRPAGGAGTASGTSIEERVQARVRQATVAVLGPERAKVGNRRTAEAGSPRPGGEAAAVIAVAQGVATGIEPSSVVAAQEAAEPMGQVELEAFAEPVAAPASGSGTAGPATSAGTTEVESQLVPRVDITVETVSRPTPPRVPDPLPALQDAEIRVLLRELAASYEAGDAQRFAALFADGAQTTDASGRAAIHALYRDFFARPESRRMRIQGLRWREDGPHRRRGAGKAELVTAPFDGGEEARGVLQLSIVVEQSPRGPRITGLHYQ